MYDVRYGDCGAAHNILKLARQVQGYSRSWFVGKK